VKIISTTDLGNIPEALRTPAVPVSDVAEVAALYDEFMETLRNSGGIGLAAPQVGISLRFFAIHYEPEKDEETPKLPLTFLINPEIVKRSEKLIQWREGCLSLPGYTGATQRAKEVKVKGLNRFGKEVTVKASGLYACALQHEIDHLDGVLFTDHAAEVRLETPEEAAEDSIIE
jgi:peptide deformylase